MGDLPSIYSEDFGKTDMAGWEPIEEYNSNDAYMEEMAANGDNLSFTPPDTSGFGKYGGDGTDTAVDTDKASGSSGSDSGGSGGAASNNAVNSGDAANKDGNGGNSGTGALFSDCSVLDKTYVFPLCKGSGEDSVYYKVVVESAVDDKQISNDTLHHQGLYAFVTGVNIQQNVREQINYTLGNTVYLYVFGDAITNLTISGFGFWECKDNGGSEKFNTTEQLLDFYRDNKVSKHGKYCKVLLGEKTFLGYLIASDIGLTVESLGLVAFKFSFIGVFQDDE